jgi:hypothetical protein
MFGNNDSYWYLLLYMTIGDGGILENAKNHLTILGSIICISKDHGDVLTDNPLVGGEVATIEEIQMGCGLFRNFASGVCAPFIYRFTKDPNTNKDGKTHISLLAMWLLGGEAWEEISMPGWNRPHAGKQYSGGPDQEGPCALNCSSAQPFYYQLSSTFLSLGPGGRFHF